MIAGTDLVFRALAMADATPTGRQILSACDATPFEEHVVLQWLPEGDVEEVRQDEVARTDGGPARFIVARSDRLFRLVLEDRSISWPAAHISDRALRTLGEIPATAQLFLRRDGKDDLIEEGANLKLNEAGVENVYSRAGMWKLNVQGVEISSPAPLLTVRKALELAGFNPDQGWIIVLKTASAKRQVTLEDTIDLREHGIEKLRLTPREINNGEVRASGDRQFALTDDDHRGLDTRELNWMTVVVEGRRWLMMQDYSLPKGYNVDSVTIAVEVPAAYPAAELDMFFCSPPLSRASGHQIPQTEVQMLIGDRTFQRWSRHRGPGSPWRMGVDSVLTHLTLIDGALAREVDA
ncbi:MAG: E2/UBC family protein [Hyphomonadaceae bacterium]